MLEALFVGIIVGIVAVTLYQHAQAVKARENRRVEVYGKLEAVSGLCICAIMRSTGPILTVIVDGEAVDFLTTMAAFRRCPVGQVVILTVSPMHGKKVLWASPAAGGFDEAEERQMWTEVDRELGFEQRSRS